jgi:hypothetical protein
MVNRWLKTASLSVALLSFVAVACTPALALTLLSTITLAEKKCTVETLKGQYVFTGRGFIEALEPGVQRMHYGFFNFDGSGKFTGKQSSSRGGKIGREKLEGTYTLGSDCSGTMSFSFVGNPRSETHWDVYVTSDGRKGHMIRMDEGNMAVRSFEK